MSSSLNLEATLKQSWEVFSANLVPMILGTLILALGTMFSLGIAGPALAWGLTSMALRTARGESVEAGDITQGFSHFVPSLILAILMGIGITVGFMFLFFPGIILAGLWSFAFHYMVDQDTGAVDSLKESFHLVKDNAGELVVVILVSFAINMVGGMIPFGGLVAAPFGLVLLSKVFDDIVQQGAARSSAAAASAF